MQQNPAETWNSNPQLIKRGLHITPLVNTTRKAVAKYGEYFSIENNEITSNQYRVQEQQGKDLCQKILKNHHKHGWMNRKSLDINFRWCKQITNKNIEALATGIANYFPDLKGLSLDLTGCTQITNVAYRRLIASICRNLGSLESLSLKFAWNTDMKDQDLNLIALQLFNLLRLKSLTLDFVCCQRITDDGLKLFGFQLRRHLRGLERLALKFGGCTTPFRDFKCRNISERGMESLGRSIVRLPKLKSLCFTMQLCDNITNSGFISFVLNCTDRLANLTQLSLNFQECSAISDGCFPVLGPALSKLQSLKTLFISFAGCHGIADKGAADLKDLIGGELPSLQQLVVKGLSGALVQ